MGQIPGAPLDGASASSPAPFALHFRAARPSDLERLVEIHAAAYPDPRSLAARERAFTRSPFGDLRSVVVVEGRGELVAHAFLHRLRACFGGAWVEVGGIGSVGVAPEVRGRGVATELMKRLHRLADRRGEAITLLFAFRQGFYARLGYATTSSRKRLGIDPRSVPDAWRALARERVGALRPGDAVALRRVYRRAAERATGWLRRSSRAWEILASRESRITLVSRDARDEPTGYVAFTLARHDAFGETVLEVDELVCLHAEARRALLGALGAMRDQVTEIVLEIAEGDPLERALLDCDARRFGTDAVEHPLGDVVGGPMVRLVDPARAIAARGYLGSGTFEVELEDDQAALRVRVRDGHALVTAPARSARARFATTRAGLAAVLYGGLRPSDAVALGLARARPELAAELDGIVALPPPTVLDFF